jgi:hypothetical protein
MSFDYGLNKKGENLFILKSKYKKLTFRNHFFGLIGSFLNGRYLMKNKLLSGKYIKLVSIVILLIKLHIYLKVKSAMIK